MDKAQEKHDVFAEDIEVVKENQSKLGANLKKGDYDDMLYSVIKKEQHDERQVMAD